ncbi:hypothetical protein BsIDN1_67660 [Bacillus safensis]|uniref:Uncharacterized protein n=1 Tax=Bacillus safensis TaxID=561879 RepID=A0A5S9MJ61_BACIA|nr:hypothetical protein BsIDN1_67660 [Bacillus safensis]
MMKKWLITSAILTLLITGVSVGTSIQKKDSQSAQSQDIIQKRDRGTNP